MIESSDLFTQQKTPGLDQTALQIGDVHVRNRRTILVHSDPGADQPGVVLALEAINDAQESAVERTIDQFVFYWALGNRFWRK